MSTDDRLTPRDVVKLAFQYQETEHVPYVFWIKGSQGDALTEHYGGPEWKEKLVDYMPLITGVDNFMSLAGFTEGPEGSQRDCLGCAWQMGTTHHLVDWPLKEPRLGDYRLPDLDDYFARHVRQRWETQVPQTRDGFRMIIHNFGLFERAWSLRGFENFLMDLATEEEFVEELLDAITEWLIRSVDLMAQAPVDCIRFSDDHAAQRGLMMGAERWRRLFKPRWARVYERVHHYGIYAIMHMCGDNTEVIPDLIEIGLDCMESCQPECNDIYAQKQTYGKNIRFWGGLGAQSILPFGSAEEVRAETRRLIDEMGRGGGYIFAPSKTPGVEVPVENIAAYMEEMIQPRRP